MGRPRQEFCKYGHRLDDANVVIILKRDRTKDGRSLRSRECRKCREIRSDQQSEIEKLRRKQKWFPRGPLSWQKKWWRDLDIQIVKLKKLHKAQWWVWEGNEIVRREGIKL
jgi:hypothetical protein